MSFRDVSGNQRRGGRFVRVGASVALTLTAGIAAHAQTYTLNTLATFNGTDGATPRAGVTFDSSGNLYGTTIQGGTSGSGTVFEIAAGTNTINTLASFNYTDGAGPNAAITLDSSGDIFGTTANGGTNSDGTVFEIKAGTGTITTLVNFNGVNGAEPIYSGLTLDSSGDLFGTTYGNDTDNYGTVFKIAAGPGGVVGGGAFTTLATFDGSIGANPNAQLTLDSHGNLYGTTEGGGANYAGSVFEIAAGAGGVVGGGGFSTIASFTPANGYAPRAPVTVDSGGNIYGTTVAGGDLSLNGGFGDGTLYKIAAGTSTITPLVVFEGTNGANPYGNLTTDGSGDLFGTTSEGGANNDGTVYEFSTGTNMLSTLATFSGTNGAFSTAGLTTDGSGNLYGTTGGGGDANGDGTVFGLTPTGSASAPEPSALLLLVPGALGGMVARRASRKRKGV